MEHRGAGPVAMATASIEAYQEVEASYPLLSLVGLLSFLALSYLDLFLH